VNGKLGRTPDTRAARVRDIIVRDILGEPVTEDEREAAAQWIASARRGGESRPFNLSAAMEKRGFTIRGFAKKLGVGRDTVRNWRSGKTYPSKEMAARIAAALKMPRLRVVTGK
jgi:DNA-binding transcriptional regulator YiaG